MRNSESNPPVSGRARCDGIDFSKFDGKRLAIQVGEFPVFCGTARLEHDHLMGTVLRVKVDDQTQGGNVAFILVESEWNGRVVPDILHGSDFCFIPS